MSQPAIAGRCLSASVGLLGEDDSLSTACDVALTHHERWDGTGYPRGRAGDDIPLAGRNMAVADVYDALTSRRSYKPAMPHVAASQLIVAGSGTPFDPSVVPVLVARGASFAAVARRSEATAAMAA